MHQLKSLVCLFLFIICLNTNAQNSTSKLEMEQKVSSLESITNDFLSQEASKAQFNEMMMNEEDINYWFDQFIFTEEVLAQISKEGFYNKLESWAVSAQINFTNAIAAADKIEVGSSTIKFGDDPSMRVNKSADVVIYILKNKSIIKQMKLTFIDVKGKLKLIQAI